jgi:hypothetical protein
MRLRADRSNQVSGLAFADPAPAIPLAASMSHSNHHIWCNNGTYFVHLTLIWKEHRKIRLRKSLRNRRS